MNGTLERGGFGRPAFLLRTLPPQGIRSALTHWSLPVGLLAVAAVSQAIGLQGPLAYNRAQIQAGQRWRLLTGNLLHLGSMHLLLDGTGLLLVWSLFGRHFRVRQWLILTVLTMLGVSTGLYLFELRLTVYVGLSGMLHGLYAAGTVALARRDQPLALVLAALLVGKLAWEQVIGPDPFTAQMIGGAIVVNAHLYGAITGLIAGWVLTRDGHLN